MSPTEIFDMYDRLFAEPGWKDLVADFKVRVDDSTRALLSSKATSDDLYRAQGACSVYNYIITLEDTMESAKKHVAEGNDE